MLHIDAPVAEVLTMFFIASAAATLGTLPFISKRILQGVIWTLNRASAFIIGVGTLVGGLLGLALSIGSPLGLFILLGIAVGIGTGLALVLRADYLLKHP